MLNKAHPIFNVALAHRGLHNSKVDENSLPAFLLAKENGFGIELDVHITKDDKIVVMHDASTLRTTGTDRAILDSTYEELLELNLLLTKTKIPLLHDVLKEIDGTVPVLVEIKAENNIPKNLVFNVLKVLESYPHKNMLAVQAFNPYVVKELKKSKIGIPVGQLMSNSLPGQSKFVHFMYRSLLILQVSKPDFFNYEVKYIHKRKIQRKKRKLPLVTWTIDDYDKLTVAKKYADNFIFEQITIKE